MQTVQGINSYRAVFVTLTMARLVLLLALVVVAIVAVSTAPAPRRRRRIIIIVIRRRPRDVSNQMEDGDYSPHATPIGDHLLEGVTTDSRTRFAREAGDEPQFVYKEENSDHTPVNRNQQFLPSYIDDIKLDLKRRYANDIHSPEILYVMDPLENKENEDEEESKGQV